MRHLTKKKLILIHEGFRLNRSDSGLTLVESDQAQPNVWHFLNRQSNVMTTVSSDLKRCPETPIKISLSCSLSGGNVNGKLGKCGFK